MESEKFCLRWNDFETNISSAFRELREDKDFFDVTLACDDEQIQVHKVILSACSPFFRNVLRRNPHQHPLLYLKGVKYSDLQSVLNFMYHGEVNVAQEDLNSFLTVAEDLKIKGLTQNHPKQTSSRVPTSYPPLLKSVPRHHNKQNTLPINRPIAPPLTVPAITSSPLEDENIQEVVPVKSEPRDPPAIVIPSPEVYDHHHQTQDSLALAQGDDQAMEYQDQRFLYEEDQGVCDGDVGGDGNRVEVLIKEESVDALVPEEELEVSGGNYKCKLCYKALDCLDTAKNHILAHFALPGGLTCLQCGLSFDSKVLFGVHMASEHKNIKKW